MGECADFAGGSGIVWHMGSIIPLLKLLTKEVEAIRTEKQGLAQEKTALEESNTKLADRVQTLQEHSPFPIPCQARREIS